MDQDFWFFVFLNGGILGLLITPLAFYSSARAKFLSPKAALVLNIMFCFIGGLVVAYISITNADGVG